MYNYSDIRSIHLEVTQNCQANCPMCDRNMNGKGINPHINLDELSLEDCKRIFTPEFMAQLDTMYMCGNLGDPIVARDTLKIFRYFREHNLTMWLSMNTNGGAKSAEWWKDLAQVINKKGAVIFSVDGLRDTNHLYRQGVNWDNVERNMQAFINAGGRARWDFLIFEHRGTVVAALEEMDSIPICTPMTFTAYACILQKTCININQEKELPKHLQDHLGNAFCPLRAKVWMLSNGYMPITTSTIEYKHPNQDKEELIEFSEKDMVLEMVETQVAHKLQSRKIDPTKVKRISNVSCGDKGGDAFQFGCKIKIEFHGGHNPIFVQISVSELI